MITSERDRTSDSLMQLRAAVARLRAALRARSAQELPETARLLESTLGDSERMLTSRPSPSLMLLQQEAESVERIVTAWEALLTA